jgi:type IV pilus assembly protein PilY1
MPKFPALTAFMALLLGVLLGGAADAATTTISTLPVLNVNGTGTVRPNLMLLYDDSGSMAWAYTPDYVGVATTCRARDTLANAPTVNRVKTNLPCTVGQPPFNSADFNKQYYNPAVSYTPPVYADGSSYKSMTAANSTNWTKVPTDGIVPTGGVATNRTDLTGASAATTNLVTGFPDLEYCVTTYTTVKGKQVATTTCYTNTSGYDYPNASIYTSDIAYTHPYYYTISAAEYCKDAALTTCTPVAIGAAPPSGYTYPAKVRWCNSLALTACQAKYTSTYIYPRFSNVGSTGGVFRRVDIVPGTTSYPKPATRTDCAGTTCTYADEMTNFANWYAYYKTRNQMMKTAVGLAFQGLTSNFNVGIVSMFSATDTDTPARNDADPIKLPTQFTGTARSDWYTSLYSKMASGATPMRLALDVVGQMYANKGKYAQAAGAQVVQFQCQLNITFVTTDGYWNGDAASSGAANNDNVASTARFCTQASGCYDPSAQTKASLADVALYWYNGGSNGAPVSLRPDIDSMTSAGVVPAKDGENTHLHMNTYALGLGVDGIMNFEKNYDTAPSATGDFYKLITGVTSGCPWTTTGKYTWPDPQVTSTDSTVQARVDDLWHSAINGHGKYFAASAPNDVVDGLSSALANIQKLPGAAAAAATSTPNISQADDDIFTSTFVTVQWSGELTDRKIGLTNGVVADAATWSTSDTLGLKVGPASDTRTIKKLDVTTTPATLKDFTYANLSAGEKAWFDNKCSLLSQCSSLSTADQATVNAGANIVGWLRGQQQYANGTIMRAYATTAKAPSGQAAPIPIVLGDIASSTPAYLHGARMSYSTDGYAAYQTAQATRSPAVFVAANDGMLHAFSAADGSEMWAYVPRITMKKLYLQTSITYGTNHQYTTDGSPALGDVKLADGKFHTVLVAGLNAGGRGFYALDVTTPGTPVAMWELCADAAVCSGINYDADIGLTFGTPQFGTWKDSAGVAHWVVFLTSGFNNVPNIDGLTVGSGVGYLYVVDVATGKVLSKTSTGSGDTTTPSGFAHIAAISANPQTDPLVTYVYGGDNLGRMYRFDFTAGGNPTLLRMADAGTANPITTAPEVTLCQVGTTTTRVVVYGTGRLLDVSDLSDKSVQSIYVLKDSGSAIAGTAWRTAPTMPELTLVSNGTTSPTYKVSGAAIDLSTQVGWFMDLDQNAGERVNINPQVVLGTLNVVSNVPSATTSCTVGGTSYLYQLDVCTAKPLLTNASGAPVVGRQLSNTSASVGFVVVSLPDGTLKLIDSLANGGNTTIDVPTNQSQTMHKSGWHRVRD